jgi:RimJ/RimL family protein N-acetyltransferase
LPDPDVALRLAVASDAREIWAWRNEAGARRASFCSDPIPYEEHERWFLARLADSGTRFLVAVAPGGEDLGYVRFELHGEEAEIGVGLDPVRRGRGIGRTVIRLACGELLAMTGVRRVTARVKPANEPSLRAFAAAGFTEISRTPIAVELVLDGDSALPEAVDKTSPSRAGSDPRGQTPPVENVASRGCQAGSRAVNGMSPSRAGSDPRGQTPHETVHGDSV